KLRHLALATRAQVVEASFTRFQRTHHDSAAALIVPALIANLPELAIAHDVDAKILLTSDHVLDRRLRQLVEALLIAGPAGLHDVGVVVGVRKSTRVGGQDTVRAALQNSLLAPQRSRPDRRRVELHAPLTYLYSKYAASR